MAALALSAGWEAAGAIATTVAAVAATASLAAGVVAGAIAVEAAPAGLAAEEADGAGAAAETCGAGAAALAASAGVAAGEGAGTAAGGLTEGEMADGVGTVIPGAWLVAAPAGAAVEDVDGDDTDVEPGGEAAAPGAAPSFFRSLMFLESSATRAEASLAWRLFAMASSAAAAALA